MIKVNQTRFGGVGSPPEEQGNCFQACVASVLELSLENAFDCQLYNDDNWFDKFNEWLKSYNLACINVSLTDKGNALFSLPIGYHIAEVKSTTLRKGESHAVVIKDYELIHDPNPRAKCVGDLISVYLFVVRDYSKFSLKK